MASFQLCWFGLILMGNIAVPWVIGWLIGHWSLSYFPKADRSLMLIFGVFGLLFETLHQLTGILNLPLHEGVIPPLWLILLWPLFSTLLLHSMRWLLSWPNLGMVLTAMGAWGSYVAGAHLIGAELSPSYSIVIAVEWAVLFRVTQGLIIPALLRR